MERFIIQGDVRGQEPVMLDMEGAKP